MIKSNAEKSVIDKAIDLVNNDFDSIYSELIDYKYGCTIYYHPFKEKLLVRNPSIYSTKLCYIRTDISNISYDKLQELVLKEMNDSITKYTELLFESDNLDNFDLFKSCFKYNKISILDISDDKALAVFEILDRNLRANSFPLYIQKYINNRFKTYSGESDLIFEFTNIADNDYLDNLFELSKKNDVFMYKILRSGANKHNENYQYLFNKAYLYFEDKFKKADENYVILIDNLKLDDEYDNFFQKSIFYNSKLLDLSEDYLLNIKKDIIEINDVNELLKYTMSIKNKLVQNNRTKKNNNSSIYAIKTEKILIDAINYIKSLDVFNKENSIDVFNFYIKDLLNEQTLFFLDENEIDSSIKISNKLILKNNLKLVDPTKYNI